MVLNSSSVFNLFILIVVVFIIWILLLSFFVFRIWRHYNKLIQGVEYDSLSDVLEKILKKIEDADQEIKILKKETGKMQEEAKYYIQKIKLLRYNPFKEVGGDQSFILALLDENKSGIVISSLHARDSTRWFAKKVVKGEGQQHKLSKEEQKVVND